MKFTSNLFLKATLFFVLSFVTEIQVIAQRIFVRADIAVSGDGSSWIQAFKTLQEALEASASMTGREIWVAGGLYIPSKDHTGSSSPAENPTKTFLLRNTTKMYGGFRGNEDPTTFNLRDRDLINYPSILSGDLDQNDLNSDGNFRAEKRSDIIGQNAYHVLVSIADPSSTLVDGFVITAGSATGNGSVTIETKGVFFSDGGGLACRASSPTIANCVFSGNATVSGGGGVYGREGSSPNISNCIFIGNGVSSGDGGAIHFRDSGSNPKIKNCTIFQNSASGSGGGIYSRITSAPALTNCIIWGNTSGIATNMSVPVVSNSIVQGGYTGCTDCPAVSGNIDPGFVNEAISDLRLTACSAAVDQGTSTDTPVYDWLGAARSGAPDLGVNEFQPSAAGRLFVDADISASGNGQSWMTAFKTLQEALDVCSQRCDGGEIWVAAGTYPPTKDQYGQMTTPAPNKVYFLRGNLKIYGGFAGTEDPVAFLPADRNLSSNPTILSGELGSEMSDNDNARRVINMSAMPGTARLDGFTIRGARGAETSGGAIYNFSTSTSASEPVISNCIFTDNIAVEGGAIYSIAGPTGSAAAQSASLNIDHCIFLNNKGDAGGAIFGYSRYGLVNATITDCTFEGNANTEALTQGAQGGAIHLRNDNQSPAHLFTRCQFLNNASNFGAGVYIVAFPGEGRLNTSFIDCNFRNNAVTNLTSNGAGGGAVSLASFVGGLVSFDRCEFTANRAFTTGDVATHSATGGAIDLRTFLAGNPEYGLLEFKIDNSLFHGNRAPTFAGAIFYQNSALTNLTVTNSTFVNNETAAAKGGVIYVAGIGTTAGPDFRNCVLWDNTSTLDAIAPTFYSTIKSSLTQDLACPAGAQCGTGMLYGQDPLFIDPSTADFRLMPCSPAIQAGDNSYLSESAGVLDLDGAPRIHLETVDFGSYEYQNDPVTQTLAGNGIAATITIQPQPTLITSNCELIARIIPGGTSAVAGEVTGTMYLSSSPTIVSGNRVFASRAVDIRPDQNAESSTARITLYFNQAEFDAYNSAYGTANDAELPIGPDDIPYNVRVVQYSGEGMGLPENYTLGSDIILPDVMWNGTFWEVSFDVMHFSGFFISGQSEPALPVSLISFTAKKAENMVKLDWSTATEHNSRDFSVQHSIDARHWSTLATIPAKGYSSEVQVYSYVHDNPEAGTHYYRLLQTDVDERSAFSQIRSIDFGNILDVNLYPNPVRQDYINIELPDGIVKKHDIKLFDLSGRQLGGTMETNNGLFRFKLPPIGPGVYLLEIRQQYKETIIKSFVVQ